MRIKKPWKSGGLMGLAAVCLLATPAMAQSYSGGADWNVTFSADKKMVSSFHSTDMDDVIYGLQPGDDAVFEVALKNSNSATTDWYMTNEVLQSLEDASANQATAGGAYSYYLSYIDKSGKEDVLYDSDTVGGENVSPGGEGLHEATNALSDYFYLDTLESGAGGKVVLRVALEGETQGNDYQDTLADLQLNFAVELRENGGTPGNPNPGDEPGGPGTSRTKTVKTGDRNMTPYAVAGGAAGLILLFLAIGGAKRRKKEADQAKAFAANERRGNREAE